MEPPAKLKRKNNEDDSAPGTSQTDLQDVCITDESVDIVNECETSSPETREEITAAVYYCIKLLEKLNIIDKRYTTKSNRSKILGREMAEKIIDLINGGEFTEETELLAAEETAGEGQTAQAIVEEEPSTSAEKSDDEPERDQVPLQTKLKAVRLAELHPKWKLKTIAMQTTRKLKNAKQLWRWKKQVQKGGTKQEKFQMIDSWVYDCFEEARNNGHMVTTRMLRQWAMAAAASLQSVDFEFKASQSWCDRFKANHRIRQRHVTKYVSTKEKRTFEELLQTAETFQRQASALIPHYSPDFVITTDQTGCEHHISSKRTSSHRSEKVTELAVNQLHHLTHSYTAQYGLTISGKVLPTVFICLQEVSGKFGPRVQQEVNHLMEQHPNVYVTATKSGKLTKETYNQFLDKVIQPYVKTEPFLFIIDSWGGQSDPSIYDEKFMDEDGIPSCSLKVIPPMCTPLCQPCDVYFYRQIKNFIRKLQNCSTLIDQQRDITARRDAIKIHALIHNQLQAPVFGKMIRYAWFASKLLPTRDIFNNVNEVSFPSETHTKECDCGKPAFARCSWCSEFLCCECFYDRYHPRECTKLQ